MKGMERSFTDREYKRKMRREPFLEQMMDGLIPWDCLVEGISPYDPQAGKGRVHYPLASILRLHCVQLSYNLRELLENRINQEGDQWTCSPFSLKERFENQNTVCCPWDGPSWAWCSPRTVG